MRDSRQACFVLQTHAEVVSALGSLLLTRLNGTVGAKLIDEKMDVDQPGSGLRIFRRSCPSS